MIARRPAGAHAAARGVAAATMAAALMLAAVVFAGLAAGPARAELTFPALTGRVVDDAHILDPATLASLDAKLAAQEAKVTDQFVVATVPSLQGTSIDDYANRLFRYWQLGQAKKNNGVLLLVAPNERKVRIEVGYGLEGIITDAVASTIIRTAIIPAFKAGDMAGGVVKGVDAILEILNLDPEEARARARREENSGASDEEILNLIILFVMLAFWVYIFWRAARSGGGPGGPGGVVRGRGRRGPYAAGPISTWDWSRGSGGWSGGGGGGWSGGGGGSSGGGGASGGW